MNHNEICLRLQAVVEHIRANPMHDVNMLVITLDHHATVPTIEWNVGVYPICEKKAEPVAPVSTPVPVVDYSRPIHNPLNDTYTCPRCHFSVYARDGGDKRVLEHMITCKEDLPVF